jgi:hypothetical protein
MNHLFPTALLEKHREQLTIGTIQLFDEACATVGSIWT